MGFFSIDNLQRGKLAVHIAQAVFIFVSWCLMIGVFRNAFLITGSPGWFFALCFLTPPAIIYQTMTPMWARSMKWGNPYAFVTIDIVYTILWLSAFSAVAAYNSTGLCTGACGISKACVGMGFFIFVFFCLTSAMSVYGLLYFRREGTLPGAAARMPNNASMIDPDREAFSTAPHDDEYAPVHMNDREDHSHHDMESAEESYHRGGMEGGEEGYHRGGMESREEGYHRGGMESGEEGYHRGGNRMSQNYDPTSYDAGAGSVRYEPPSVGDPAAGYRTYGDEPPASHYGYGDEDPEPDRVQFPAGNYH